MVVCETVDEALESVARSKDEIVVAWHMPIGDSGATQIAESLKTNGVLKKLTLHSCEIGHKGGMELCKALDVNKTLEVFDYCENNIGGVANRALREVWVRTRCQWSEAVECSGGKLFVPVFARKSPAIAVNQGHVKNESQFQWAKAQLAENERRKKLR